MHYYVCDRKEVMCFDNYSVDESFLACKNLGTEEPEYIVHGEDIMVKFKALQSAKVTEKVTGNLVTESEEKVLEILRENQTATYLEIADKLKVSRKTVSQKVKSLKEKGLITSIGSAKKGYWKVI